MNLNIIQHHLNQSAKYLQSADYSPEFAVGQLHSALQLLVNELARLQPEHPELTEAKGKEHNESTHS